MGEESGVGPRCVWHSELGRNRRSTKSRRASRCRRWKRMNVRPRVKTSAHRKAAAFIRATQDLFPITGMALERNPAGSRKRPEPALEVAARGVSGDGKIGGQRATNHRGRATFSDGWPPWKARIADQWYSGMTAGGRRDLPLG